MAEYFDFVLCKHDGSETTYLFRAPAFSHLEKGDEVIVETSRGEQKATVVQSTTINAEETRIIDFIMNATGASNNVKKVLSKVVLKKYEYYEEDENNG